MCNILPWPSDNIIHPRDDIANNIEDGEEDKKKLLYTYDYNRSLMKGVKSHGQIHGDSNNKKNDTSKNDVSMWLDVKVWYVRVTSCVPCDMIEAPDTLMMVYPPRDISIELEVDGQRVHPSKKASFLMSIRRVDTPTRDLHSVDQLSNGSQRHMFHDGSMASTMIDSNMIMPNFLYCESYTYVSTNHLRVCGDILPFEIYDNHDELIAYGNLTRSPTSFINNINNNNNNNSNNNNIELGGGYINSFNHNNAIGVGWVMDCVSGISSSSSCSFLAKSQMNSINNNSINYRNMDLISGHDTSNSLIAKSPSMEVYVVGMCYGHPIVFTCTLCLQAPIATECTLRRSRSRSSLTRLKISNFDVIPKANEELLPQQNHILDHNNIVSMDNEVQSN